jgi:hypothetical protein
MAACCSSGDREASQCAENGVLDIGEVDLDLDVMLVLVGDEEAEVAAELVEGAEFVVEFEFDPLYLAGILARSLRVSVDGHLGERGGLVARQPRKIEVRIAVERSARVGSAREEPPFQK